MWSRVRRDSVHVRALHSLRLWCMGLVAKHLMDRLQEEIVGLASPKPSKKPKAQSEIASDTLFQFKITLMESEPPIWRRIQVKDCTLDKLHEHIQTAMGWTNSHLHEFEINGQRHGDPDLLDDGFEDFECIDSTKTIISDIVPEGRKRFAFRYEYDFGDGWDHAVVFEGYPPVEKGQEVPALPGGGTGLPARRWLRRLGMR